MYLEFLFAIADYFKTLSRRIVIYEIILPLLLSGVVFCILLFDKGTSQVQTYTENVLPLLGVLVGFSITIITILTTSSSKNILKIQKYKTGVIIGGKERTLFDTLLINFTYSVIIEIILIIIHLFYPFVLEILTIPQGLKYLVFALVFAILIHILLLNIRNLTDFYFILLKKEK